MFDVFTMNDIDRECAIVEKAYEIEMAEVAYLEAMIDAKLRINMAKSEYKVMTESTAENAKGDLIFLFNEAGKEAEANSESIFTKAKNAIVGFFIKLWNAVQKPFTGENTEAWKNLKASQEKVKLGFDAEGLVGEIEGVANSLVTNPKEALVKIGKIVGGVIAAAGALFGGSQLIDAIREKYFNKEKIFTKAKLTELYERASKALPKFGNTLKNTENTSTEAPKDGTSGDGENKENFASKLFSVMGSIGSFVKGIISKIGSAIGIGGKDVNDPDETKGTNKAEGTDGAENNTDYSSMKASTKKALIAVGKQFNILDKSKGNAIKLEDMENIVSVVKDKIKAGKAKNLVNDIPEWEKVIQWMKDNNVNEYTLDFAEGDVYTESEYIDLLD